MNHPIRNYPFPPAFILIVILVVIFLLCSPTPCDGQDARSRLEALKKPKAEWSVVAGTSSQAAADQLYVVSGPNCGPCVALKRQLEADGIPYTELTTQELRDQFNRTVAQIPYSFYLQASGNRVGRYGTMNSDDLAAFVEPLQLHATASASPGQSTCRIPAPRTTEGILRALVTHLAVESGGDMPMGGLADIHVPLPAKISDLLVLISHHQRIDLGRYVTASWQDLSITSSKGRTTFDSPVVIEGRALGISLAATLKEVYLHEDGRTLDIVVEGFPDLRVVFD